VFIPDNFDLADEDAFRQARNINLSTPDGVVRLDNQSSEARKRSDRAALLAMLYDQVGDFNFRHDDVAVTDPEDARIPVQIAIHGRAATACYFAVHGLSNDQIAASFGVGSRTISQYISDFQKGER